MTDNRMINDMLKGGLKIAPSIDKISSKIFFLVINFQYRIATLSKNILIYFSLNTYPIE